MTQHLTQLTQGEAEDRILFHRFNYYVLGSPLVSDATYDEMERELVKRWSGSRIAVTVGSENEEDYPSYVQEGRRPLPMERVIRDRNIVARWNVYLWRFDV